MTATAWQDWGIDAAKVVVEPHLARPGSLLCALQDLQAAFGYIDDEAVPLLADLFNLSRAEVFGVLGFYHDLRRQRPGRHVLKICQAEACQSMGARSLNDHAKARLGIGLHETGLAGRLTVEPVYCLGNCALAPAVMFDGAVHGRVDDARLDRLIEKAKA